MSLPLTATGASGAVYRLRQALFDVTNNGNGGNVLLSSEQDPLSTTLESSLPAGNYNVSLQPGWFLEKASGGSITSVQATLMSPSIQNVDVQVNGESTLFFVFQTSGEVIQFGQGRLVVDIAVDEAGGIGGAGGAGGGGTGGTGGTGGGGGTGGTGGVSFDGLIQTNPQSLQTFSLRNTLDAAIINAGFATNADTAYHSIIDSYAPGFQGLDPTAQHCDSQGAESGGPGLNGFPLQCGRLERLQFNNLDTWFPIAAVNRLDLAPVDGSNCGQQRLIFANNSPIGNGRMLLIVEAQVPNPNPGCGVNACLPIAQFWAALDAESNPALRASMLRSAFLDAGIGSGFGPFVNANGLGLNGGQIRTNNFNDSPWTLREFHFDPSGLPRRAPVADSPNGALWNDFSPLSAGPLCRNAFLGALGGLLTNDVAAMSFTVPTLCADAESRNDFSQDYASQLNAGGGAFRNQLDNQLIGTGLTAQDIAARARFAGSCIGCHQESSGAFLGAGVTAPFQFDFVHVSERTLEPCGDGSGSCFGISDTLRSFFLPHRQQVMTNVLSQAACGGAPPPAFAGSSSTSLGSLAGPASGAPATVTTLGGQLASPHGH